MCVQAYLRQAGFCAAALILWAGVAVAQNTPLSVGDMGTVVLGHGKPRAAVTPRRDCGGGGLVGKTECDVTQNMETTGSSSEPAVAGEPTSMVVFGLSPVLELVDGTHRVRVNVKVKKPQFAPDIGRGAKRRLMVEARAVEQKLNEWRLELDAEQVAALRQGDDLPVDVVGPFDGLRLWSLESREPLAVSLSAPPAIELRFVRKSGGKYIEIEGAIPYGRPFFLEAQFEQPEDDAFSYDVELDWDGGGGKRVSVTRTFDDDKVFRSNPLYLETPE